MSLFCLKDCGGYLLPSTLFNCGLCDLAPTSFPELILSCMECSRHSDLPSLPQYTKLVLSLGYLHLLVLLGRLLSWFLILLSSHHLVSGQVSLHQRGLSLTILILKQWHCTTLPAHSRIYRDSSSCFGPLLLLTTTLLCLFFKLLLYYFYCLLYLVCKSLERHTWLFKFKLIKIKSSVPQTHEPHFCGSMATCGWWPQHWTEWIEHFYQCLEQCLKYNKYATKLYWMNE